ncbi:Titin [Holothuria leucospilota]|uniref:Titin n=1 Tax=Holothuria leucospilota TaxID=206669 RepID=A0A9Q1BZ22_HOLLE|nr:Titin [Holothuria leucospilota]
MTIIQGEPLQLKCSFHGYPIPTILWYKDGTQLDPEAGYKTTSCEGVAMLTSQSTKEGDEGMFSCVAVNPEGDDITSCNVLVEISTVMVQPSDDNCTLAEVRSDVTDKGLPCANPDESGKTAVDTPACKHDENLTVGFHEEDLSTSPKPPLDPLNGEVTKDVADTVALPLRIKCLKCGNSLCTIEVTGGEWCEK